MPNAPKLLYQGQPAAAGGTLATVPASTKWIVTSIIACNTSNGTKWLSVSRVPNAGAAGVANRILHQAPIGAYQTITFDLAMVMETAGDFLWAQQETTSIITVTVSGYAVT